MDEDDLFGVFSAKPAAGKVSAPAGSSVAVAAAGEGEAKKRRKQEVEEEEEDDDDDDAEGRPAVKRRETEGGGWGEGEELCPATGQGSVVVHNITEFNPELGRKAHRHQVRRPPPPGGRLCDHTISIPGMHGRAVSMGANPVCCERDRYIPLMLACSATRVHFTIIIIIIIIMPMPRRLIGRSCRHNPLCGVLQSPNTVHSSSSEIPLSTPDKAHARSPTRPRPHTRRLLSRPHSHSRRSRRQRLLRHQPSSTHSSSTHSRKPLSRYSLLLAQTFDGPFATT